jgi:tricorn protease
VRTRHRRHPDAAQAGHHGQRIAFVQNDIWVANRGRSSPHRITAHPVTETSPHFSPEGHTIAFTGNEDGNEDVYTATPDAADGRKKGHFGMALRLRA